MDSRRWRTLAALAGAVIAIVALPSAAAALNVSSAFGTNDEGWRVAQRTCPYSTLLAPTWNSTGGNPDGYISDTDVTGGPGETCFWWLIGPAAFTGDMRANYGGTLSYDVKPFTTAPNLSGNEFVIAGQVGNGWLFGAGDVVHPADAWTHETASLTAGNWVYVDANSETSVATVADMFAVLQNVREIQLIGDLVRNSQGQVTGFDNIALANSPIALDSDGDGVTNAADACPAVAGPNNGCPGVPVNPNLAGDGVSGSADHCPDGVGPASNGGCPLASSDNPNAACEAAQAKLKKAQARLKKLKHHHASKAAIEKAKRKVKKARGAVAAAC